MSIFGKLRGEAPPSEPPKPEQGQLLQILIKSKPTLKFTRKF